MQIFQRPLADGAPEEWPGYDGHLNVTHVDCEPGEVIKLKVAGHELRLWAVFSAFDSATPCHVRVLSHNSTRLEVSDADAPPLNTPRTAYVDGRLARRRGAHRVLCNYRDEAELAEWQRGWDDMNRELGGTEAGREVGAHGAR